MLWIALVVFLLPLVYVLLEHSLEKRARNQKLDQIQRRLAEKEAEARESEQDS